MRIRRHNNPREIVGDRGGSTGRTMSISYGTGLHRYNVMVAARADDFHVTAEFAKPGFRNVEFTAPPAAFDQKESDTPSTADDWVQQNTDKLRRFVGRWVAVSPKGIIAASKDFDEVFLKSKERGVLNPLVFKVPQPTAGPRAVSSKGK